MVDLIESSLELDENCKEVIVLKKGKTECSMEVSELYKMLIIVTTEKTFKNIQYSGS